MGLVVRNDDWLRQLGIDIRQHRQISRFPYHYLPNGDLQSGRELCSGIWRTLCLDVLFGNRCRRIDAYVSPAVDLMDAN